MTKTSFTRRTFLQAIPSAAALTTIGPRAFAQAFPDRPITLVAGWGAGTIVDTIARLLAAGMEENLGQKVIVENRPSTAGAMALADVAAAKPDGYRLMVTAVGTLVVNPHTTPNLPADPINDFEHICMIAESPLVVTMNPQLGVNTMDELVALAKSKPGKINVGSAGAGSTGHLTWELVKRRKDIDLNIVHYKGAVGLHPDLLANEVSLNLDPPGSVEQYLTSGRLKFLFITSKERSPKYPDVPTTSEVGLEGFDRVTFWVSLEAPKGTPRPILDKIRESVRAAMNVEANKKRLGELNLAWVDDTPESFLARVKSDSDFFKEGAVAAGFKP